MEIPDIADRHRRYLAFAFLSLAGVSVANAVQRIASGSARPIIETTEIILVLCTFASLIPMLAWKVRNSGLGMHHLYRDETGFVAQSFLKAKNYSWVVTFLCLSALPLVAKRLDAVPSEFFLYVTTAVMLGVFGLVFLFMIRDPDVDEGRGA